jgi:aldose sugar dehydrogenase
MRSWLRTVSITLTATLATAAVASLLQTQINLHALTELGLELGWQARADVTVEDLARFGPVMFGF